MKKIFIYIFLVFIITITFALLWSNRIWPFTTGSTTSAFLGTTFDMSVPEAQRVLKKRGTQLVGYEKYKELDPDLSNKSRFTREIAVEPIFSAENKKNKEELWYMPSVEMFESRVVAEFTFTKNKLTYVDVSIFPYSTKNTTHLHIIESIATELKKKYRFIGKEDSKEVPGAYSLIFESNSSRFNLWVNLTDQSDPIINLFIIYHNATIERETKIKNRQMNAF